jgi:hypothetical protein
LRDGVYGGSVTMDKRGLRLIGLTGGGAELTGDLVMTAPSVAVGLTLGGGLVMAPEADGSVVVGVRAAARSVLLSERSMLIGVASAGGSATLLRALDRPTFVAAMSPDLAVRLPTIPLEQQGSIGGARGWVDSNQLRAAGGSPWSIELEAATVQGWFAAGLARHTPDRVPMEAAGRWIPVYGDTDPTAGGSGLAVPLSPAPWLPEDADLVVLSP